MKILQLSQKNSGDSIFLKVLVGEPEFRHLKGFTNNICMFASQSINEPVKITKTGAKHSFAKWFLLPAKIRTQFITEDYDYKNVSVGYVEYKDCVFFIYRVNKKGLSQEKIGVKEK